VRGDVYQLAGSCSGPRLKAPFWLAEGFSAYGDYVVHKTNRWYTTYAGETVPLGDWMVSIRKLAAGSQQRDWVEFFGRELRDWEPRDHYQSMSMVAFLLESEPARFLDCLRRLRIGEEQKLALENAFQCTVAEHEERWVRWLLNKR
jgi:hypothetical protein